MKIYVLFHNNTFRTSVAFYYTNKSCISNSTNSCYTTTQLMVVQSTTVISDDGCNTALLSGLIATSTLLALSVLINIFVLTMMLFKKKLTSKTKLFA